MSTLEIINQPQKLAVRHINKTAVVLAVRYRFADAIGYRMVLMTKESPSKKPGARSCTCRRSRCSGPCDGRRETKE